MLVYWLNTTVKGYLVTEEKDRKFGDFCNGDFVLQMASDSVMLICIIEILPIFPGKFLGKEEADYGKK